MAGISIYKRNQGQVTRSVTAIALAVIVASICYYIHERLLTYVPTAKNVTEAVDRLNEDYELVKPYEHNGVTLYGAGTVLTDEARKAIIDAAQTPGASPKVTARRINALSYAVHVQLGVPILLFAAAAFGIFRLVNHERFADFLIATEADEPAPERSGALLAISSEGRLRWSFAAGRAVRSRVEAFPPPYRVRDFGVL
ncbi:MAG TPA: hypothetical protein PLP01_13580, partial [Phycisphaerae bacterium]|nr:hypothetical protein [Phycisphaerae bacterium]